VPGLVQLELVQQHVQAKVLPLSLQLEQLVPVSKLMLILRVH
jgi:hypothetical protein